MTDALSEEQKSEAGRRDPARADGAAGGHRRGAVYLASDEAGWVTGTTLHVNGGMAMI